MLRFTESHFGLESAFNPRDTYEELRSEVLGYLDQPSLSEGEESSLKELRDIRLSVQDHDTIQPLPMSEARKAQLACQNSIHFDRVEYADLEYDFWADFARGDTSSFENWLKEVVPGVTDTSTDSVLGLVTGFLDGEHFRVYPDKHPDDD